jgi:FKBP-type peptidyl-prolyl cis-trans isomerase
MISGVNSLFPRAMCALAVAILLCAAGATFAQSAGGAAAAPSGGYPISAYSAFGSSMADASHFGLIGWSELQFDAFLAGMRAVYQGKPYAVDDVAHQLSAEMGRRISDVDAGTPMTPRGDFPLGAYSAFGSSVAAGGHFGEIGWTDAQFDAFLDGMRAVFQKKPFDVDEAARRLAAAVGRRIAVIEANGAQPQRESFNPAELVPYMKEASKRYHLQLSESGLGYNVSPSTNGIRPRPEDTVVMSCDAVAFDGTSKLPQLSSARIRSKVEQMFPGLREGLQMMTVNSHAIFVVPPALSFGHGSWPDGVEPGSPIIFNVDLREVISQPPQSEK